MKRARADRILDSPGKWVSGPIVWRKVPGRAVAVFEVPVHNELGESLCLSGQYVPQRGIYKLQLFAEARTPIYRFESDKKHHCPDCRWIRGPHVNRPTDECPKHGEPEQHICANDIRTAVQQFAERVNIRGAERVRLPPPPSLQEVLELEGGANT